MPSSWDDTRFLYGSMGEYVVVARRDGHNWFIGVITNTKDRSFKIDLNSLWFPHHGHPSLPPYL